MSSIIQITGLLFWIDNRHEDKVKAALKGKPPLPDDKREIMHHIKRKSNGQNGDLNRFHHFGSLN